MDGEAVMWTAIINAREDEIDSEKCKRNFYVFNYELF